MLSETSIKRRDNMAKKLSIAAYCRISVDDEKNDKNTSIENQKVIINKYIEKYFPGSDVTFFEDRDKSGFSFNERPEYQRMRPLLMKGEFNILIVKDLSRFARTLVYGLAELNELSDAGVRTIAIEDNLDYPDNADWFKTHLQMLFNEMPVRETSKKVKSVVQSRQKDGKWICSVPYGYVFTNTKKMQFEVDPEAADVVRKIFELYISGWGYKKIANYLTEQHIPTPKMREIARMEAQDKEHNMKANPVWSIATIQPMIKNDFYIGTLRQGKYTRKKINGDDVKNNVEDHIVFPENHEAIIDFKTFAVAQEMLKSRTRENYRGVKKYANVYSGLLFCGDCESPMFAMSRKNHDAYRCGAYHQRGLKGCTSHFTKTETLDSAVKYYLLSVKNTSENMIDNINAAISKESKKIKESDTSIDSLKKQIEDIEDEIDALMIMQAKKVKNEPAREEYFTKKYDKLIKECEDKKTGIENQIKIINERKNNIIRINRLATQVINIFDYIIEKDHLDNQDLQFLVEKIYVYEDNIKVKLKNDIESILSCGFADNTEDTVNFKCDIVNIESNQTVQMSNKHRDKVYGVNVICEGDPLEIYTDADGEVIFKKYSPMGEMSEFTSQYAEVLYRATNMPVIITDRDHVISCTGLSKKDTIDRHITKELEEIMENRSSFIAGNDKGVLLPVEGLDRNAAIAYPIVGGGDVSGAVILLFNESGTAPTQSEIKLAQVAASFLGKQTEE